MPKSDHKTIFRTEFMPFCLLSAILVTIISHKSLNYLKIKEKKHVTKKKSMPLIKEKKFV